jgi:hypothetical protein
MSVKKTLLLMSLALAVAAPAGAQEAAARFLSEAARAYRDASRYPDSSWALRADQADPVREKRTPSVVTAGGQDGAPEIAVWSGEVSYEAPGDVDLFASLAQGGRKLRAERVTAEVLDAAGNTVDKLVYRDDGVGADRAAGDGVYSARVSGLPQPELAAAYLVRVEAARAGGETLHAAGGFLHSRPWARLTGAYRDSLRDGNVVVAAQLEVTRAGRFHLAGTLATADGRALGTAQNALELTPGRHWVELSFYGLMFHDRGAAGPYRLASLALATTGGMPNALSRLVEDAHLTRAYALAELRATPFERADVADAAARLEAEAVRVRGAAADPTARR